MKTNSDTRGKQGDAWEYGGDGYVRGEAAQAAAEKLLPQNVEAEAGTLGSLLIDPEGADVVADWLTSEMFYREAHRCIYQCMWDLNETGTPADLITLSDELDRRGLLEDAGGMSYISSLANQVPTSANLEYYARIVERCAVLRKLIHAAGQIAAVAYNNPEAEVALDQSEQLIMAIRGVSKTGPVVMGEHMKDALTRLDAVSSRNLDIIGVPTGFRDIDRMTGGLQKTDLIILAARPAVGKTSLALSIARHAALDEKKSVLIFSLEMSREQLTDRFWAMESGVDLQKIRQGRAIDDEEWARLSATSGPLAQAPLWIDDTAGLSIGDIRARARRLCRTEPIDLIIVDYLQLLHGGTGANGKGHENRVQEVSAISRGLKELAKELHVPVLALSQLSRAVEARSDRRPMLSDLRESGSQEQDADIVAFLHRSETYNPETTSPNIAEVIVAKHRNGPVGSVSLFFQAALTRYRDLELTYQESGETEYWWQDGKIVDQPEGSQN
jgi:replicative DNA helicase